VNAHTDTLRGRRMRRRRGRSRRGFTVG